MSYPESLIYIYRTKLHEDNVRTYQCRKFLTKFGAPLLVRGTTGRHFGEEVTELPTQRGVSVQVNARDP
jgi:hypothetical protein